MKDFNRTSLKSLVEPTVYFFRETNSYTLVKLGDHSFSEGIAHIEDSWSNYFQDTPLDIVFLDERFERLYKEDKRFGNVFGTFSALAILIAVLGLFGLSSFMAIQRMKEMGIRKVLGATIPNIVGIFYRDFAILIGISSVLSLPILYLVMDGWLDNYAYRISFPWFLAGLALVLVLFFALITVGYQIYKVAVVNPAKIIRYE